MVVREEYRRRTALLSLAEWSMSISKSLSAASMIVSSERREYSVWKASAFCGSAKALDHLSARAAAQQLTVEGGDVEELMVGVAEDDLRA